MDAFTTNKVSTKKLISDPNHMDLKDKVIAIGTDTTNPYIKVRYWVKEEQLDLAAILEAISIKEALEKKCADT